MENNKQDAVRFNEFIFVPVQTKQNRFVISVNRIEAEDDELGVIYSPDKSIMLTGVYDDKEIVTALETLALVLKSRNIPADVEHAMMDLQG